MGRRVRLAGLGSVLLLGCAGLVGTAGTAAAVDPVPPVSIVVEEGMTQPVHGAAQTVTERVWVETEVDTDSDGELDRVAVDVDRPIASDGSPLKVASILTASPYLACCRDVANHPVDLPELPQEDLFESGADGAPVTTETHAAVGTAEARAAAERALAAVAAVRERYVPRGYAVVTAQTVGTADSDGCPTIGDRSEVLSVKAVVQWLAGNRTAFDQSGDPVDASWSTGDVGMIGVSYDGTLPQMVATTGVRGLRTIVPISAISSWYDYYRANGLVVAPGGFQGEDADVLAEFDVSDAQMGACADEIEQIRRDQDRETGDYNRFWRQRDYVAKADGVKASVFAVHGLDDWNVKTEHIAQFWHELTRLDVPRKIWLHQFGHGGPPGDTAYDLPGGGSSTYDDTVNRWLDHWLYDVDNGVMDEPRAIVQREGLDYRTYADWPAPAAEPVRFRLAAGDPEAPGTLEVDPSGPRRQQSMVDAGRTRTAEALVADAGDADANRLVFVAEPLDDARRLSGTPKAKLRLSVDNRGDANVTALLVDYAPDGAAHIVTRGWIDPQNRDSPRTSEPVREGRKYTLRFGLQPDDFVFRSGHRIGLVVISTDYDYTIRPEPGARLTLGTRHSSLRLPLTAGGS